MKKPDGGPAYFTKGATVLIPKDCTHAKQIEIQIDGMSLRDWYAGLAMQSLLLTRKKLDQFKIASESHEMADAMLKEREKE